MMKSFINMLKVELHDKNSWLPSITHFTSMVLNGIGCYSLCKYSTYSTTNHMKFWLLQFIFWLYSFSALWLCQLNLDILQWIQDIIITKYLWFLFIVESALLAILGFLFVLFFSASVAYSLILIQRLDIKEILLFWIFH